MFYWTRSENGAGMLYTLENKKALFYSPKVQKFAVLHAGRNYFYFTLRDTA